MSFPLDAFLIALRSSLFTITHAPRVSQGAGTCRSTETVTEADD
jgi:hypothetical protein